MRRRVPGGETPAPHGREQRGAFDEAVARGREDDPPRDAVALVVGAPHALQERGDAARGVELADELDRPHVDAELQRRGRDEGAQLAGPQAALDALAALARERAVVRGDRIGPEALAELVRDPLGELACIDEHERRAVARDVRGDAVEDLAHLVARQRGLELAVGQLQRQLELARVPAVDDGRQRARGPHEQAAGGLDGPHGRRQPDANRRVLGDGLESLERESQMRSALVARERVDLVDDHRLDRAQRLAGALGAEVEIEGLGRRDEQVRRPPDHRLALVRTRVSRAHGDAHGSGIEAQLRGDLGDLDQRRLEVGMDVDGERLQRAQVDDLRGALDARPRVVRAVQRVDRREKAGERLARAGRRADQGVLARADRGPAARLGLGGTVGKAPAKPRAHGGVEVVQNVRVVRELWKRGGVSRHVIETLAKVGGHRLLL
jgi:hypothetical protein